MHTGEDAIERHLLAPIQPTLKDGKWVFLGGSGWKLATSVVSWLKDHPEVEVRAVIPVIASGEVTELWLIPR